LKMNADRSDLKSKGRINSKMDNKTKIIKLRKVSLLI